MFTISAGGFCRRLREKATPNLLLGRISKAMPPLNRAP
jgi:hypothetical protein